jgi:lysophospholipase L1-like esterase
MPNYADAGGPLWGSLGAGVGAARAASDATSRPVTYVAIGASDAIGVGADDPDTQSWPAVLASWLPPRSRLINLGVPGITLHRALEVELPVALDAPRPGLITVWLAVNDFASGVALKAYVADLQTLLHELRARTRATILVGNLPDLAALPSFRAQDRAGLAARIATWNAAIAATARRDGATLVDLYARWRELAAHPEYVSSDGFHPSTAGYRRLASLFWAALP